MPSTSAAQHRAMEAAAHGKSTLGIPKTVGHDFVEADKNAKPKKKSAAKKVYPQLPSKED